jgi:hypothetical protein
MSGAPGRNGPEVNTFAQFLLADGLPPADGRISHPANPRRKPTTVAKDPEKARKELLIKGLLLCFIGALVLLAPAFIHAPGMDAVAGSSVVGWFALALGLAFILQWALRRNRR